MENLNTIPKTGSYGEGVDLHNDNYQKIGLKLTALENRASNEKGYFESLSALQLKYPTPQSGWQAYVKDAGSSTGYYVANVDSSGNWVVTSAEAPAVGVNLNDYTLNGGSSKTTQEIEDEIVQLAGDKIDKTSIKQTIGSSEINVLSQKAISDLTSYYSTNLIIGGDFEDGQILQKVDGGSSVSSFSLNTVSPISGSQDARLIISTPYNGRPYLTLINNGNLIEGHKYRFLFDYKVNSGIFIFATLTVGGAPNYQPNIPLTGVGQYSYDFTANGNGSYPSIYAGDSICDIQLDNLMLIDLTNDFYNNISEADSVITEYYATKTISTLKDEIVQLKDNIPLKDIGAAPSILVDTNTILWIDALDKSTITKNSSNRVSSISCKLKKTILSQELAVEQPTDVGDGILFDENNKKLTGPFNALQSESPFSFYMVVENLDGTYGFLLNSTNGSGRIWQVAQGRVSLGLGTSLGEVPELKVGRTGIINAVLNGNESYLQINKGIKITNSELISLGGFYYNLIIGGNSTAASANFIFKELIVRKGVDNNYANKQIYQYLADKYDIHEVRENSFDSGKIALTFDDMTINQYTNAFPILMGKNEKATFYVVGKSVETHGGVDNASWAQLREMRDNGMDIQCHTYNHVRLGELTDEQVKYEMDTNSNLFATNGLPAPIHLAYPFGNLSESVIQSIQGRRITGRLTGAISRYDYFFKDVNKFRIPSILIDTITEADFEKVKIAIKTASERNACISLYAHGVLDGGSDYAVDTLLFKRIIDYAKSLNMQFVTMSELYELLD